MTNIPNIREKIFVVDDLKENRMVAEGILLAADYDVVCAQDGEEALNLLEKEKPDLVLLDILMPKLNGFSTCRLIREAPQYNDLPIVFLSALDDVDSHEQALKSGADDFIAKPINRLELLLRIRSLLRIRKFSRQLLRSQQQRQELASYIVHDLKNPLSAIIINGEYISNQPELTADTKEAIHDIISSAKGMKRLILNLLDTYESEDVGLKLNLKPLKTAELFEEVLDEMEGLAKLKSIRFEKDIFLDEIVADRDILHRVLENLVENGVKYSPPESTIHIQVEPAENGALFRVDDSGPGIPPEFHQSIFERHTRLHRDQGIDLASSRGLGLAFCRIAAEAHGGAIWVENRPTQSGTTFKFRIAKQQVKAEN